MDKIIKILTGLTGLIVVFVVAIIVIINSIDVNEYKDDVIILVETKTGRKFSIDGDLELALSLTPSIRVEGVKFANADWASQEEMISVGALEVEVALLPLLSNTIQVNRLILNSSAILLETNNKGVGNWVFEAAKTLPDKQVPQSANEVEKLSSFSIKEVKITDVHLSYLDGVTGKVTNVVVDEITINGEDYSTPLEVLIKATYNENPILLEGRLGAPKLLLENNVYPIQLTTNISDAVLTINGKIADLKKAHGLDFTFSFQVESLDSLSKLAKSELPAYGPIHLTGKLADTEGGYVVNALDLKVGKSDLIGSISVKLSGERPFVKAELESMLIDLTAFLSKEEQTQDASSKEKKIKVFPAAPLPLDVLKVADVDIALSISTMQTNSTSLDKTNIGLSLKNGKLILEPLNSTIAEGKLVSSISLDGSDGETAIVSANIKITDLQPGLLPNMKGKITGSPTDLDLQIEGGGQSVADIMASVDGKVLLQTGEGQLINKEANAVSSSIFLKIYRMLNPDAQENQGTQIECFVVNLDINDGYIPVDKKIALETNHMNVIGSGAINFKSEELDLGVTPEAREGAGISVGQLAELVRLKGSFANPKLETDTKAVMVAGVSAGAAIATDGLSVLAQGLFDKITADKNPCATAMGVKTARSIPAKTQDTKIISADKTTESVKKAEDVLKKKLKGLFDR